MQRAGLAVAVVVLVVGVAAAAGKPVPNVRGVLVRPASASCPAGEPCDPSPVGVFILFSRSGRAVARARVRPDGSFALHLRPGRYGIELTPPASAGRLVPSSVRVPRVGILRLRLVVRQ